MRGMMASNSSQAHNVQAPSRPVPRDRSPDPPGRSGCCTGFLCLGSLKRGKRIVPATRMHDGNNQSPRPWASNGGAQQSGSSANQYATLSPSLLAPPSSPASFQNSAVQSSAQSPCSFPVVSVPSATSQIPLETAQTMFQMGPYAHETALVSPPVFSNFTTAPSTAPFTPPPELATHLTTPSSPDVPFAQLLANSFGQKQAVRLQPAPTYSASPFASPDIFSADDLQAAYQLYPGSPLAHLLSPASGTGASTPFPELEVPTPVQAVASMFVPGSPLTQPDPPSMMELQLSNSSAFQQDLRQQGEMEIELANSSAFQQELQRQGEQQQQLTATISSFLASGGDPSWPRRMSTGGTNLEAISERLVVDINEGSDGSQTPRRAALMESSIPEDSLEQEQSAGEYTSQPESGTGISTAKLDLSDGISLSQDEQSKREESDQIDRSRREEADTCNLSSTGVSVVESLITSGVSDDISTSQEEQGKRGFSDASARNPSGNDIFNLGSSDSSNKTFPSSGNGESVDIAPVVQLNCEPSEQAVRSPCQNAAEASNASTGEGAIVSDGISFPQLEKESKHEFSGQADSSLTQIVSSNLVTSQVSTVNSPSEGATESVLSVQQHPADKGECFDQFERDVGGTVTASLGSTTPTSCKSPSRENGLVEEGTHTTPVQSPVHASPAFNSSLMGFTISDLVAWETAAGDKIPTKLSVSKVSLVDTNGRNGSAVHSRNGSKDSASSVRGTSPRTRLSNGRTSPGTRRSNGGTSPVTRFSSGGTSPVTRFSNGATSPVTRLSSGGTSPVTYHQRLSTNGGTYTDCVRLQHVTVAASEGYFDVFSSQQFTFAGQKFVAEPNCSKKENMQEYSPREKPECERGVLKVLLHHSMEKPVGVEGMDRVAIYREQQLNVPVNWIQSGAKLHQRGVDSVSRELPELGGTCSGSKTGPSTQLGMNLVEELK